MANPDTFHVRWRDVAVCTGCGGASASNASSEAVYDHNNGSEGMPGARSRHRCTGRHRHSTESTVSLLNATNILAVCVQHSLYLFLQTSRCHLRLLREALCAFRPACLASEDLRHQEAKQIHMNFHQRRLLPRAAPCLAPALSC
jgi:hypothetical protein